MTTSRISLIPTAPHVSKIPWRWIGIVALVVAIGALCWRPLISTAVRIPQVPQLTITYLQAKSVTVNARNPIPKEFPKEGLKVRGEGKTGTSFLVKFFYVGFGCQMWFGYEQKWLWFTFENWTRATLPGFPQFLSYCTPDSIITSLEAEANVADSELKEWLETVIRLMKVQWRWTG